MSVIAHPLTPLVALSALLTALLCLAIGVGIALPPATEGIMFYGWMLMVLLWMDADARRTRRQPCFDFGTLAVIYFTLSLPWYCWWSRRWTRGPDAVDGADSLADSVHPGRGGLGRSLCAMNHRCPAAASCSSPLPPSWSGWWSRGWCGRDRANHTRECG
jgi:hypothetical protein